MQNLLLKADRFFAWVLFLGMFLYFVSGYGMTKGIIDASLATKLHINYLSYIVLIAFTIHTSYSIHLAFKRWRIWNSASKLFLIVFFMAFFCYFFYIEKFYNPNKSSEKVQNGTTSEVSNSSSQNSTSSTPSVSSDSASSTYDNSIKTFTLAELSKYNGENGNPAYVAVDGDIYDLSSVFTTGKHFSHYAGTELTNAFYSYHAKRSLSKYPIVGKLVN